MKFFGKIAEWVEKYDDTHNFTCDICAREVFAGERVCAPCKKLLPWNSGAFCPLCGRRVKEEGVCLECKEQRLAVDTARSALVYEGEVIRLLARYKQGEKFLVRTLTELSLPALEAAFPEADAFVYVPMTEKAQKRRGYNQGELLCARLAEACGVPMLHAAVKTKETAAQKFLGRREREKNLEGCFKVADRSLVKGKRLVIIDDALTTGATVSELARVLLRAGAAVVNAFTVASVENKAPFGKMPSK